ncbi:hypothetical protein T484DRAFT_1818496 [Baffinella frigidus]|nr:hypothetical protein T484DRAFT_1818496 [Cryptophyta sp. CCMP2293]
MFDGGHNHEEAAARRSTNGVVGHAKSAGGATAETAARQNSNGHAHSAAALAPAQQRPKEHWGFYDRPEQVDGLLAFLNPAGRRETELYEQLSMRYMKLTGNMRRHQQAALKADAVLLSDAALKADAVMHSDVRRSIRVKVESTKRLIPFLSYRNLLKEPSRR